jgi:hypothetical protein
MTTYLHEKIEVFYKKKASIFKKPLEKIINSMLDKCRYINGESLERHNWGGKPIKLKHIPKNISSSPSFEEELLNALNLEENEKSIIELLWGDIQLGKRVQACIIMWISVHIFNRPVLYIFRNLTIDQKQLQEDIVGTEKYNFNIEFIKSLFEEFNTELQDYFDENNVEYWKDYKLPELKDINSNGIIDKLNNKEAINSSDILCCLMNPSQLEKLNKKFSEYISNNDELVNITTLIDEGDLMCATSSNDRTNNNDKKDTTACEIEIAKISKKVRYVVHITGTPNSLLCNATTRVSDNIDIQIPIGKVHKMKRSENYFGLLNNSITFNTMQIKAWWDYIDSNTHKKRPYDIVEDYNINIKNLIEEILRRPTIKYNSLLISEEKIRANQFYLVERIIKDFPHLLVVIYHGKCLRLYIPKEYEKEILKFSEWDAKQSSNQRLWQDGGVYNDKSIDTEKSEKIPNNYCYFDIDTKKDLNIKHVYKLLRIFFEESKIPIIHKSVITITGKYGERGYSFTSDDYDKYSFHLTDQYFVSHASLNCTDILQRTRLQGKYNDPELKSGDMKLTLWTTNEVQDIIQSFYVKFIKVIEKYIMSCDSWEDIKVLLGSILDNGDCKFGKYMKYIDVVKKRKNLKVIKHYDGKNNGYKLITLDDMTDNEISEWCKETKLPDYNCINEITSITYNDLNNKDKMWYSELEEFCYDEEFNNHIQTYTITHSCSEKYKDKFMKYIDEKKISSYNSLAIQNTCVMQPTNVIIVDEINNKKYKAIFKPEKYTINIDKNIHRCPNTNKYLLWKDNNGDLFKSKFIDKYIQQYTNGNVNEDSECFIDVHNKLPNKYYWKTPDGWLYLYDKDKPDIISLDIVAPIAIKNVDIQGNIPTEPLINKDILLFATSCCKETDKANLRFGVKDIFQIYEKWCEQNNIKRLKTQKKFKEEFEKLNYREENSKGVDINNKYGKRGYNIMVSL